MHQADLSLIAQVVLSVQSPIAHSALILCGQKVVKRTRSDKAGGAFIHYDGHPSLLECEQVPSKYRDDFKLLRNFPLFNTNNIWVHLETWKERVSAHAIKPTVIP